MSNVCSPFARRYSEIFLVFLKASNCFVGFTCLMTAGVRPSTRACMLTLIAFTRSATMQVNLHT